jgi:hypothetical protein
MNLIPPGFNIEVRLPAKGNTLYVAVACYANGLQLNLKHMLPYDGYGSNYWRLRGTLEVLWATDTRTRGEDTSNDVSPFGDAVFLEAVNRELRRQFGITRKDVVMATWPDDMHRNENPHVVMVDLTCTCCRCFVK